MKELIATIHFIGLALFSSQVPNETGLRVLLPRIEDRTPSQHVHLVTDQRAPREVEDHNAYIIFQEDDLLQEIGWTSAAIPPHMVKATETPVRYRYVALSGDRVAFYATGNNLPLARPALDLPRPTCGTRFARITARTVSAIFEIRGGELQTCMAEFQEPAETRYDTQLLLRNNGVITIWASNAATGTKLIVLRGGARVFVANVPSRMIFDELYSKDGVAHYHGYYDLIKASNRCPHRLEQPLRAAAPCPASAFRLAGDARGFKGNLAEALNSDCSNSTWP